MSVPESLQERRQLSEQINQTFTTPPCFNQFGQPVGPAIPGWVQPQRPSNVALTGQYVSIVSLDVEKHLDGLWDIFGQVDQSYFTYLFVGPYTEKSQFKTVLENLVATPHCYMAILDTTGKPVGYVGLININTNMGSIEIGSVCFGPQLQGSRRGTETIWLLMQYAIGTLGYRRLEWKCDSHNAPSRRAALRYGFTFEGLFKKHFVYRGNSRDTTWYAITDDEYTNIMLPSYTEYLSPDNFNAEEIHLKSLPTCREPYRVKFDQQLLLQDELLNKAE